MGPKSRGGGGGGGKKKDKGPRGRRARRKAKLDRRWGEEEEEPSEDHDRGRRGRRRDVRPKHHDDDDDDDDGAAAVSSFSRNEETKTDERRRDGADDDDDRGVDGGGLQSLLQRIQSRGDRNGEKRKRKDRSSIEQRTKRPAPTSVEVDDDDDDDDDDVTSDDSEHESSDDDDDEGEKSVENNEHEDGDNDNDPFTSHFSATPFETAEEATASVSRDRADHDAAIDVGAGLDPTLELRASGAALARSYQETTTKGSRSDATMPYLREALAARWSDFNAGAVERNADGDGDDDERRRRRRRRRSSSASDNGVLTPLQARLCPALFSYADLLITAETRENRDALHRLAAAHVLNHVSTSRVRVKRHDRRIRELRAKEEERETERLRNDQQAKKKKKNNSKKPRSAAPIVDDDDELAPLYDPPNEWKDQGFTRPKVLVLLPTRGACSSFVHHMAELCRVVEHRDRFEAEYGPPPSPPRDGEETPAEARRKRVLEAKGPEWNELFGDDVNDDDDFRIGLSLEGSGSAVLKLYTEFYKSDVVLASPLGLKMAALRRAAVANDDDGDADGENNNDDDPAAAEDWDFLSSVEICLVLRADVALMQNWDHVVGVLERLNRRPVRHNDADFSRVRPHLLVDQGAHRRQTIVCSALSDAQIASTFRRFATSRAGALRVRRRVPLSRAAVGDVLVPARQIFRRVPCEHSADRSDARARFFLKEVLPRIVRARQRHTLVYVPSYFDFVTLRNALTKRGDELLDGVEFVSVTEYARVSEVSRGRARFLQGRKHLMLYTGRAHFFSRNVIKGATHLVFLGLPEHGEFYPGMVNELREDWSTTVKAYNDDDAAAGAAAPASCLALYTKYDAHEMERIVGTNNCDRMIHGDKGTYMFC